MTSCKRRHFPCKGIENPCGGNDCSHVCLLSSATCKGYSCACPGGGKIMDDGKTCNCELLGNQNRYTLSHAFY